MLNNFIDSLAKAKLQKGLLLGFCTITREDIFKFFTTLYRRNFFNRLDSLFSKSAGADFVNIETARYFIDIFKTLFGINSDSSGNGDSDVVNHLLEYKQIDVNIQTEVSRMVVHPLFFNIFFKINLSFV